MILFMRIHKTAGEALAKQISDHLPAGAVFPGKFDWQVRATPAAELRRHRFFEGHITPSSLSALSAQVTVFTMLRDPRERLLSCFYYWKQGARHTKGEFFEAMAPLSLLDFLRSEDPIIRRVTWNVQARLLAGGQFGGVDHQRQAVFGPWLDETALAGEALRALDRFAFVGTTEQYDESLKRAFALLKLGEPPPPERINVTAARPASYARVMACPQVAQALGALTEVDQIVYDAVRARASPSTIIPPCA